MTREGANAQTHIARGHLTWDFCGTEALHLNGAALKHMPGSLGNSRSVNTYILCIFVMIQKISDANMVHIHVQYSNFNHTARTEKFSVYLMPLPSQDSQMECLHHS